MRSASIEFFYSAQVTQTASARLSQVNLQALNVAMGGLARIALLKSLVIPFTIEKEPNNQSRSSGATLLGLALVMLVISICTIDLSWIGIKGWLLEFLGSLQPTDADEIEFKDTPRTSSCPTVDLPSGTLRTIPSDTSTQSPGCRCPLQHLCGAFVCVRIAYTPSRSDRYWLEF